MKQKDYALVAIVVIFSAVFSIIISNILFATPKNRQQTITVVGTVSPDFSKPDNQYFNSSALDPSQLLQVNISSNTAPFGTKVGQ